MMEELPLRNFSEETIRSYIASVERFALKRGRSPATRGTLGDLRPEPRQLDRRLRFLRVV